MPSGAPAEMRTLSLTSLTFGLVAMGGLSLAVATDYWLYSSEPYPLYIPDPTPTNPNRTQEIMVTVKFHSGLWRACPYYDDLPGKLKQLSFLFLSSHLTFFLYLFSVKDRLNTRTLKLPSFHQSNTH